MDLTKSEKGNPYNKVHRFKGESIMIKETGWVNFYLPDICRDRLLHYAGVLGELAVGIAGPEAKKREELFLPKEAVDNEFLLYQRQQLLSRERNREDMAIMSQSLQETAGLLKQLAMDVFALRPMELHRGRQIIKMLRLEGILAENPCYYPTESGQQGILLTLHSERRMGLRAEEVADMLSVLLGYSLQLSLRSPAYVSEEKHSFLFVPEAPYLILTGYAKATKEGELTSGDNLAVLEQERGRVQLLISDGTGSGGAAGESSGWVLDMMERLLETGYSVESGADMVNSALLYQNSALLHPTLDVCDIDLYRGKCSFYKAGGARSYLKREGRVEEIRQDNLPLGFFEKLGLEAQEKRLMDGDYLIMVSDGVTEVLLNGQYQELFHSTLEELADQNPQVIAEKLLQLIIRLSGGHICDDMTILVAGIWEKAAMA